MKKAAHVKIGNYFQNVFQSIVCIIYVIGFNECTKR